MTATRHISARQWGRKMLPGAGAASEHHRTDGYRLSRRAWVCRLCMAWHDRKPRQCYDPCAAGRRDFLYFGSKVEGQRFMVLWRRLQAGRIRNLRHHPKYPLVAATPDGVGAEIGVYEADSYYEELLEASREQRTLDLDDGPVWVPVVEDVKPRSEHALDPLFEWKRRHFEAQYGITLRIVN